MLKKLQALQPASQAAVLRMTTSSREPQECLFDVGLTLDPESPFTFARYVLKRCGGCTWEGQSRLT